jgi:hypothetical protein
MNKENEYKKEIFDLLSDDIKETTDDTVTLNLLKELFLADIKDINNEEMLKSMLKNNIYTEDIAKIEHKDNCKETTEGKTTLSPFKNLLFSDIDNLKNEDVIKKSITDE